MQNDNFSFEVINWLWLSLAVDQNHSLTEVVSLELLLLDLGLDGEADGLTAGGFLYVHPLVMNALDLNGVKLSLLVRAQK